ncbi:ankyrin repeat and ibr domain-containing protein, partial [Plakobranchus ocellatus]
CDICADLFLLAEEPVHMTCSHRFCKDCWEKYLNLKIQEGDAHHITCPAYGCSMLVPVDIIEGIVSRDMALRYLQFDIKAFVDSNPDMKWCPAPGCGRAVKLPDIEGAGANDIAGGTMARSLGCGGAGARRSKIPSDTSRGVDCGMGHYFCWECLEESHEPCSCDNWTKWFQKISEVKPETLDGTEQETELAANCLWLVTNSKACPNCKSPIQKNEGCNHMKCSKCKFDFCWVCLEPWKRHNTSTGGYFKCNRFEVVKKVEEQSVQMVTEAETKNKHIQELNRFVHYYTRFKNHENSYRLEEPLLKTAKDKMMKLAEAVTDNATANTETRFVEEAVQQLLKARRVLKCSYVYGFYLDGPGYKKIVFEFMQTELEECTEILSQMVNRLYLRTPRRRIVEQARAVQRKRLEFISAISKGLVPPETPPAARKGKKKRKQSGETVEDEDLRKAILASIQEVDPANPWIKDASGRHTNVATLLEWPAEDSEDSDGEVETREKRERIGKCHRAGCNKVRARNPKTNEIHDYCSMWCLLIAQEEENKEEGEGMSEIVLDEHMELLRALEMSRLQYLQDSGLLHVPRASQDMDSPEPSAAGRPKQRQHARPRSNSTGQQESKGSRRSKSGSNAKDSSAGISSMEELGLELQRFQELSSAFPTRGADHSDLIGAYSEASGAASASPMETPHLSLASWLPPSPESSHDKSGRRDEVRSTIVPRVPNKSVEDLYCIDEPQASASTLLLRPADAESLASRAAVSSSMASACSSTLTSEPGPEGQTEVYDGDVSSSCLIHARSDDNLSRTSNPNAAASSMSLKAGPSASPESVGDNNSDPSNALNLFGSMFGAIKNISVSNIHARESDKTKDFLTKDLASIFSGWDLEDEEEAGKSSTASASTSSGVRLSAAPVSSSSEELSLWPLPPLHVTSGADSLDQKQSTGSGYARRPLTLDTSGASGGSIPTGSVSYDVRGRKSNKKQEVSKGKGKVLSYSSSPKRDAGSVKNSNIRWAEQRSREKYCLPPGPEQPIEDSSEQKPTAAKKKAWKLEASAVGDTRQDVGRWGSSSRHDESADDVSLLQMAENLLQMTADVHSRMQEVENGIHDLENTRGDSRRMRPRECGEKHEDKEKLAVGDRWRESSNTKNTKKLLGKEEKETRILFRLPKSAWSLEGYESEGDEDNTASLSSLTDNSQWRLETQKKPPSSPRQAPSRKEAVASGDAKDKRTGSAGVSECSSKGSRKKSSGKSSKKSKHKPQAVALMSDAGGQIHEVSVTVNSSAGSLSPKERARTGRVYAAHKESDDLLYASPALRRPDHKTAVLARDSDRGPHTSRAGCGSDNFPSSLFSSSVPPEDEYDDIDMGSNFLTTGQGAEAWSSFPLFPSPPPPAPPSPTSQSKSEEQSINSSAATKSLSTSALTKDCCAESSVRPEDTKQHSPASRSPQNIIQYSLRRNIFSAVDADDNISGSMVDEQSNDCCGVEKGGFVFQTDDCTDTADRSAITSTVTAAATAASALLASDHGEITVSDAENWEDAIAVLPNDERVSLIRGSTASRSQSNTDTNEDGGSIYV